MGVDEVEETVHYHEPEMLDVCRDVPGRAGLNPSRSCQLNLMGPGPSLARLEVQNSLAWTDRGLAGPWKFSLGPARSH